MTKRYRPMTGVRERIKREPATWAAVRDFHTAMLSALLIPWGAPRKGEAFVRALAGLAAGMPTPGKVPPCSS